MPPFVRAATFELDDAALDAMVNEIESAPGPPEDVPGKRITILADLAGGKAIVAVRFDSKEDLDKGSAALDAMEPPADVNVRRLSVDKYEVVLERDAP
jgi:hypothetical protein